MSPKMFTDDTRHLDRFGWVLGLAALSVTVLSLVNLDDAFSDTLGEIGVVAVTGVLAITLMVSVRASGLARRPRIVVDGLALLSFLSTTVLAVAAIMDKDLEATGRPGLIWVVLTVAAPVFVIRRVIRHERVTRQTLAGAVSAFLLIALAFCFTFLTISGLEGDTLFFGEAEPTTAFMYFSLVTITTLGYGDLTPAHEFGRYLATTEAVLGQIFLVTFVARLVSLYGSSFRLPNATTQDGGDDASSGSSDTGGGDGGP